MELFGTMTGLFTISMMPCVMAVPSVFEFTINSGRDFGFLACAGFVIAFLSLLYPVLICRYVYVVDQQQKPKRIEMPNL